MERLTRVFLYNAVDIIGMIVKMLADLLIGEVGGVVVLNVVYHLFGKAELFLPSAV